MVLICLSSLLLVLSCNRPKGKPVGDVQALAVPVQYARTGIFVQEDIHPNAVTLDCDGSSTL